VKRCAVVDVDGDLVIDSAATALKSHVVDHLDQVATFCGVDIFLLGPKFASPADGLNGNGDAGRDQRWRIAIYGDMESAEHAKTRVLIFIDRLVSIWTVSAGMYISNIFSWAVWSTEPCSSSPSTQLSVVDLARTSS
jgi:hypothetical protein